MTKKYLQLITALVIIAALFIVPVMANNNENNHNQNNQKIDVDITNNNQHITNNDVDIKNTDIDVTNNNVDNSVTNNVKNTFDTDITNNNIHNDVDITNNDLTINTDLSKTTNNVDNSVTNNDYSINTDLSRTTNNDNRVTNNDNRDYSINTDLSRTTNNNDNRVTNNDNRVDNSVTTNNNQVTNTDRSIVTTINTDLSQKTKISGSNNEQVTINGGNIGSIGTKTYNQQQYITQTVSVIADPKENPDYYKLSVGLLDSQIISLYNGEVFVVTNDNDRNIPQKEGDVYRYTVKSSLPVLAYVISSTHNDKAEFDKTNAPFYDVYMHKFDLSNLPTVYVGKYRSPNQQFNVTLPENGRYSLVIDTRVSQELDGHMAKIESDSLDISYTIEKVKEGQPSQFIRPMIGEKNTFATRLDGTANTNTQNPYDFSSPYTSRQGN